MKYVYLWYVKITHTAMKKHLADSSYGDSWLARAKEVVQKHGYEASSSREPLCYS